MTTVNDALKRTLASGSLSDNVMRALVAAETEQQLLQLPPRMIEYVHTDQVKAYALNRLPALYATSERGWERQWHRGHQELRAQIALAVRQGFAAVQRDPLRQPTLRGDLQKSKAEQILQGFRDLLNSPDLEWDDVLLAVEEALEKASKVGRARRKLLSNTSLVGTSLKSSDRDEDDTFDWDSTPLYQR